jgi:LPXTG-motif cell wall-anchored protein
VPLPATGPAEAAAPALGLAAMVAGLVLWRRSRRNVLAAARTISRG